jgi:glycosyltransferase involved in cell wall biosynthesis
MKKIGNKIKLIRITTVPESLKVLLKGQLKFMSDYFEVIAISSPGKHLEGVKVQEGIEVIPLKMTRKITPISDLIALIKLIFILIKEKPDIVHTHTPKAGLLGMIAAKITQVPVRMHTIAGMPLTVAKGFKKKLLILIEKLTYASATNIYPNSIILKKYIIENKFCKKEKLKVIGKGSSNGIDTTFFYRTPQIIEKAHNLKTELKIPDNAFIFLFVGRIVKDKGINELIEAFSKIENKNTYLILVGNYEQDLDPLENKTYIEINNNEKIIEVGYQNDVRPYFAMSDVFVFPSYREGFPNVVLQAGAMEVPSIVSNINGSNEIIENNKNGLVVKVKNIPELKDAMNKLLHDKKLLQKLKTNCRYNIVENYKRGYIWEQLLNEYTKLIDNVQKNN